MKPILVWGASGFIGSHLIKALADRGTPVLAVARRPPVGCLTPHPLIEWLSIPLDESAIPRFAEAIRRAGPIFSLAGSSGAVASNLDPAASLEDNCQLQIRFLRACELSGTKPHVVFASSRLVYGTPESLPVTELTRIQPLSFYAAHKNAVEHYHRIAALRSVISFTICRISNPYGGRPARTSSWRSFIDSLIDAGCQGRPIEVYGDGRQLRDYIYIVDLIDALWRCAEVPEARNEVFNIGSGESLSIREAAEIVSACTGTGIANVPWNPEAALVESGDYVVDIRKARTVLGFAPRHRFAAVIPELIKERSHEGAGV